METRHGHDRYIEDVAELEEVGSDGTYGGCADFVYESVFRTDLSRRGYAHIRFASKVGSLDLRRAMLVLARQLSDRHPEPLTIRWALRFDQQVTSRFHRDNGPEESYLLLGYEPSPVASDVSLADFSRAASDAGIIPAEYIARFNPMFAADADRLSPYVTHLTVFDPHYPNLLIINNSVSRLGVFHRAAVPAPIAGLRRVINSVQIAPLSLDPAVISPADRETFLVTDGLSGP